MLFGRLDPEIWVARGFANVIVLPFIAVATARNTGWTVDLHLSRRAVFHSTALLVSGAFLLAVAGAGYVVRFFGGAWGRALQIEVLFASLLLVVLIATSGALPLEAQGVRQQALLLVPIRLPRGMAALHPHALHRKLRAEPAGAHDRGAGRPGGKPRRDAVPPRFGSRAHRLGALEPAAGGPCRPRRCVACDVPRTDRLDRQHSGMPQRSCALCRSRASRVAVGAAVSLARSFR